MRTRLSIIIIALLLSTGLIAQQISSKHYTVNDQLPSNICYRILQDDKGFVLVATEKGIAVFDGYVFKPLYTKNKLSSLDIWGIFKDVDHRLWLKTKENKYEFIYRDSVYDLNKLSADNHTFRAFVDYNTSPVIFTPEAKDTAIYILNQAQQLHRKIVSKEFKMMLLSCESNLLYFNMQKDQILFVLANSEIIEYNLETKLLQKRIFTNRINTLLNSSHYNDLSTSIYYFSCGDSIYCIRHDKVTFLTTYSSNQLPLSISLKGITKDGFFYNTENQLKFLDTSFKKVERSLPKINSYVSQVFEDNEGNLWYNTVGDGVYFVNRKALGSSILTTENGLLSNHVLSIQANKKGDLYIGNYSQNAIQYVSKGQLYSIPINQNDARQLLVFENGNIMVNNNFISKQAIKIDISTLNSSLPVEIEKRNEFLIHKLPIGVKSFCKLDEQHFLIGTSNELLKGEIKENTLRISKSGTVNQVVYSICAYHHTILLGTPKGLFEYKEDRIEYLGAQYPALNSYIRNIQKDKLGYLWIASDKNNLECYDSLYNKMLDFPEIKPGVVTSISVDSIENTIYASTSNGLYQINIIEGKPLRYSVKHYSMADGLTSNEVNASMQDAYSIYVATSSGLCILPKLNSSGTYIPKIYCTKLFVNNKATEVRDYYSLPFSDNNIRIELTALSYQSLGQLKYYYRLKELSNEWVSTQQRVIEFSSLKPGNYTFEAKAIDINNTETSNQVHIQFEIVPPFWKTWWFNLLLVLLLLALSSSLLYFRFRKIKLKELQEATNKKERAELTLNALQSQLNSHFVYNSLNAIQNFIFNHDEVTASEYMNKFAKLIRLYLESSRNKLADIGNEIELITLYTSLEKLRFEDKFDVMINTDKMQHLNVIFPTNIIQPLVENAILHGLLTKESKGFLKIDFIENESEIVCIIDDNGIGREESARINQHRKRKSFGMQLIQDKLVNIGSLFENQLQIEIIDKKIPTHSTNGTIVKIVFKK